MTSQTPSERGQALRRSLPEHRLSRQGFRWNLQRYRLDPQVCSLDRQEVFIPFVASVLPAVFLLGILTLAFVAYQRWRFRVFDGAEAQSIEPRHD
jgi:hypothetical protein